MEENKKYIKSFYKCFGRIKNKMIEDIEKYNHSLEKQLNKIELASAEIENNRKF